VTPEWGSSKKINLAGIVTTGKNIRIIPQIHKLLNIR
jgi:hypothetical protein